MSLRSSLLRHKAERTATSALSPHFNPEIGPHASTQLLTGVHWSWMRITHREVLNVAYS